VCLLHLVAVFSDLKKLCVTVWQHGILTLHWWTHGSVAPFHLFLSLGLLTVSSLFVIFSRIECHKGQSVSSVTLFSVTFHMIAHLDHLSWHHMLVTMLFLVLYNDTVIAEII
jgi:hypothetical protein